MQGSKLKAGTLTHRPAYRPLCPLLFYLFNYIIRFSQSYRLGESPFSLFFVPPSSLNIASYIELYIPNCSSPFTTLHLSCHQNDQCLVTSNRGLINSLNRFHYSLFSSFQLILDTVTRLKTSIGPLKPKQFWKRTKLEDSPSLIPKVTTKHQQCGAGPKADITEQWEQQREPRNKPSHA